MRFGLSVAIFAAIPAAASCSKPSPVANGANEVTGLPVPANATATGPAGAPPEAHTAPDAPTPPASSAPIAAALQGRWGLTPADCTSTLGDAKGLLVISANELRFYESRAVPAADIDSDADSISGNFNFTGEGQSWTKYESFRLDDRKLVRTETQPNTSFTYARC